MWSYPRPRKGIQGNIHLAVLVEIIFFREPPKKRKPLGIDAAGGEEVLHVSLPAPFGNMDQHPCRRKLLQKPRFHCWLRTSSLHFEK